MTFVIKDCPATFEFELSDGSSHSMPVPASLSVARALKLDEDLRGAKDGIVSNKVFYDFLLECCPELEGTELSGYVISQIASAWYKAAPEK